MLLDLCLHIRWSRYILLRKRFLALRASTFVLMPLLIRYPKNSSCRLIGIEVITSANDIEITPQHFFTSRIGITISKGSSYRLSDKKVTIISVSVTSENHTTFQGPQENYLIICAQLCNLEDHLERDRDIPCRV